MFNIGGFFKRVQNSFSREILVRTAIKAAIKKQAGFEVPIEKMAIKGSIITLKDLSPGARSVIFIKKQAILKDIATAQDLVVITDIR